jgi:hypothetical protein
LPSHSAIGESACSNPPHSERVRAIVADRQHPTHLALVNVQLLPLDTRKASSVPGAVWEKKIFN